MLFFRVRLGLRQCETLVDQVYYATQKSTNVSVNYFCDRYVVTIRDTALIDRSIGGHHVIGDQYRRPLTNIIETEWKRFRCEKVSVLFLCVCSLETKIVMRENKMPKKSRHQPECVCGTGSVAMYSIIAGAIVGVHHQKKVEEKKNTF